MSPAGVRPAGVAAHPSHVTVDTHRARREAPTSRGTPRVARGSMSLRIRPVATHPPHGADPQPEEDRVVRTAWIVIAIGLLLPVATPAVGQSRVFRSAFHDYRVVTVADGLEHPWSVAFLPGGDMLVTERPGRLRIVRDGTLLPGSGPRNSHRTRPGSRRASRRGPSSRIRVQPADLPELLEAHR